MTQLLHRASLGWAEYTADGKLAAALLASLLFLWFGRKGRENLDFLAYASAAAVCCILPVTAILPMLYQTAAYDYVWIWSLVPVTAATAYGITVFLSEYWKDFDGKQWKRGLPVALLVLCAVLSCGSLGREVWDRDREKAEREEACLVMEELSERLGSAGVYLWAPREILEYARETDAGCRLLYGRNMWDESLGAYAYDAYDERRQFLYRWMEALGEAQEAEHLGGLDAVVESVLDFGIDCILLPGDALPETVERMERGLGTKAQQLGDYLLFTGFRAGEYSPSD